MKKKLIWLIILTPAFISTHPHLSSHFSLSSTATWKEYVLATKAVKLPQEKWAWTGSLTLRSKEPLKLTSLVLKWHGEKIWKLAASLYEKKKRDKAPIPIEDNLVCDGSWNPTAQQLLFSLEEKIIAVNQYHLVLSFPKHIEHKIKKGTFSVLSTKVKKIVSK